MLPRVQSRGHSCASNHCHRPHLHFLNDSLWTSRYCAFVKKKKRTDERVCWIQGEPALVSIKVCNPYVFPLFVEAVGIEACVEDGTICDIPLEFNSSRGFELPPSLNGITSIVSVDLSVTPAVPGVISIKVCMIRINFRLLMALTCLTGCLDPLLQHPFSAPH